MKSMKHVLPLSLALVCGTAAAASGDALKPKFDKLDINGNDRISVEEAKIHAELARNFDKLDRNDNKKLSRNEYRRFKEN